MSNITNTNQRDLFLGRKRNQAEDNLPENEVLNYREDSRKEEGELPGLTAGIDSRRMEGNRDRSQDRYFKNYDRPQRNDFRNERDSGRDRGYQRKFDNNYIKYDRNPQNEYKRRNGIISLGEDDPIQRHRRNERQEFDPKYKRNNDFKTREDRRPPREYAQPSYIDEFSHRERENYNSSSTRREDKKDNVRRYDRDPRDQRDHHKNYRDHRDSNKIKEEINRERNFFDHKLPSRREERDQDIDRPDRSDRDPSKRGHEKVEEKEKAFYKEHPIEAGDEDSESVSSEYDHGGKDRNKSGFPIMKKKFNFLMILPKNYFRFIEKEYDYLYSEIKRRVRDIDMFQYDHRISGLPDYLLRIDANKVSSKSFALKIVCDVLFDCMKQTYNNMSYLKVSILVPSHVCGFIIGIEGKNINTIRDITGARIEVFQHDIVHKYRQIELQGSPEEISKACEKIYKIVNKYYFFNQRHAGHGRRAESGEPKKRVRLGVRTRKDRDDRDTDTTKREKEGKNIFKKESITDRDNEPKIYERKESYGSINKSSIKEDKLTQGISVHMNEKNISEVNIQSELNKTIQSVNTQQFTQTRLSSSIYEINGINELQNSRTSTTSKIPLNVILTNQEINKLKNTGGNIFIEIENKYHCSISKRVEKLSNNDVNILTLCGTPEQNTLAMYTLQQAIVGKDIVGETQEK